MKVLTAFCQIIHSRNTGICALREKCINDTIVRADYRYIRLYLGLNKRKSGFGCVRVAYLNKLWAQADHSKTIADVKCFLIFL
jgi:hypothetical protein